MALSETAQLQIRISAQNAAGAVLGQLNQQFGSLQSTVMRVGAAIAGAFAARDVLQSVERFTHDLDALGDAMGLSGVDASKWNIQARYVGITADDLALTFRMLANNVYLQADAIAKGTSDFDKLGISVLNAQGQLKPMNDLLDTLRSRMKQLDAPSQAVLERQLFGRSGGRLHDFLLLTDTDVKRLNEDLDALGMTLGSDVVAGLEQQQREMNRLGFIFDAMKLKLGQALIPLFLRFADAIGRPTGPLKLLLDIGGRFLQWVKDVADKFGIFLRQIKEAGFGAALLTLWENLKKVGQSLKDDLAAMLEKIGVPADIAKLGIEGLALAIQGLIATWIVSGLIGLTLAVGGLILKAGFLVATAIIFNDVADALERTALHGSSASDALAIFAGAIGLIGLAMGKNPLLLVVSAIAEVASTIALVVENWDKFKAALMTGVLGDIPLFGALFSAIKNAVSMMGELREGFEQTIDMVTGRRRETGSGGARQATSVDIFDLYQQLLGREPENPEAITGRLGRSYEDVRREIYNSIEAIAFRASKLGDNIQYPGEARAFSMLGGAGAAGAGGGFAAGGFMPGDPRNAAAQAFADQVAAINRANIAAEGMADGGIVMPRSGGTWANIGEGGEAEAVIPLDRLSGLGGQNISIVINGAVDSRERVRELAREVGNEILRSTRSRTNFALG